MENQAYIPTNYQLTVDDLEYIDDRLEYFKEVNFSKKTNPVPHIEPILIIDHLKWLSLEYISTIFRMRREDMKKKLLLDEKHLHAAIYYLERYVELTQKKGK